MGVFLGARARLGAPLVVLLAMASAPAAVQGRRVVDLVRVGDEASEQEHEYAGDGVTEGVIEGRPFRQARGWLSYELNVYDDSEVALSCTFRGTEGRRLVFDLLVEGRKVVTHTLVTPSAAPTSVEIRVPSSMTRDLTRIFVTLRAVSGPTPGLIELRTVQEHLERERGDVPHPVGEPF